jgi:hypothetical protein
MKLREFPRHWPDTPGADRRLQSAAERQRDLLIARLNSSAEIAELSVSDERLISTSG